MSLVSHCRIADSKTSDLIGYLLPIACHNTDCATVAERTYYLIGCETREDLRECRLARGTLKVVAKEKEAIKSSSVPWRLLQDTQGIQNRLKIEDPKNSECSN